MILDRKYSSWVRGGEVIFPPRLLAALLLLAACSEEVSFPPQPPYDYRTLAKRDASGVTRGQLRSVAGKGALDCGVARDRASADRVGRCATRALKARRPFYCRYDPVRDDAVDVSPSRLGGVWGWQAAYVGTTNGSVLIVLEDRGSRIVTQQVLSPDPGDRKPIRLLAGMTPPRVTFALPSIDTGKRRISGIVIFEAVIDEAGVVTALRVIKLLPDGVEKAAEDIVKRSRFEPSRLFGTAVPVFYNVTVEVHRGIVHMRPPVDTRAGRSK